MGGAADPELRLVPVSGIGALSSVLTEELSAIADQKGAAGFGVTGVEIFEQERAALRMARETDLAGPLGFTFEDPVLATDPTSSFPWARSMVVVSYDYIPASHLPAGSGALVARFATADQYEAVRAVTSAIADRLRARGHRAEVLSDDNRLVDRAAAVRAGVGWWGKSTMVLAPGHGPWLLLGSVVTDAALESSSPMRRDCGTCTACIPACPTQALGDWGLDARRCLSTWLQTPGSIPQWIRPRLGRRVYGCDDCLTACPPGRKTLNSAGMAPVELSFTELLGMTDDALLDRFGWWYVPRRQGRFIRRNLLVAAGNSAEPEAWNAVMTHSLHLSSMIRGHAYWAIARGFAGGETLRAALETETVPEAIDELILALLMFEQPESYSIVLTADEWARSQKTIRGLALIGPHASARFGAGDVEVVPVADDGGGLDRLDGPMVRVYDPDRLLERHRRMKKLAALAQA